ncbi:MAG: peptidylprolyl isomerase [Patescibacteria group bacterium]
MPSLRIISIIIFSLLAVFALYAYIFQDNPIPKISTNTETPFPIASPTPSDLEISPSASPFLSSFPLSQPSTLKNRMNQITLQTNLGDITFETYDADAPKTVQNFITLAQKGFYKNVIFHRVIKGFMIQGGDPTGTGTGGPGYAFEDELNSGTESYKRGYIKGMVAMANAGPNTNGSQFFIMLNDTPLPHNYTIFGIVIAGQNVVDAIGNVKTNANDKPLESVIIKGVIVNAKNK